MNYYIVKTQELHEVWETVHGDTIWGTLIEVIEAETRGKARVKFIGEYDLEFLEPLSIRKISEAQAMNIYKNGWNNE